MIKTRWRLFGNLRKGMEKMDKKDEIMLVNQESLAEKIYIIRGQKVMLDFELAEIYGYETKRFNEQVKRNIKKFDEDFMFQLTDTEVLECSRSQNATLNMNAIFHQLVKKSMAYYHAVDRKSVV